MGSLPNQRSILLYIVLYGDLRIDRNVPTVYKISVCVFVLNHTSTGVHLVLHDEKFRHKNTSLMTKPTVVL